MKQWIFNLLIITSMIACNSNNDGVKIFYGEKFEVSSPLTPDQLIDSIDNQQATDKIQVSGTIEKSCSHRGCWLTLENDADKKIFVTYKEDAFTTAKKIDGKKVTLVGKGSHNSEKDQYEFVADGVILN